MHKVHLSIKLNVDNQLQFAAGQASSQPSFVQLLMKGQNDK